MRAHLEGCPACHEEYGACAISSAGRRKGRFALGGLAAVARPAYFSSAEVLPSSWRATISSWICCVPSKMSRIFASRAHFSSSSLLAVAERAAQLDAAQRDVDAGAAGLGLGHRGLQRVRLAVVGHPRGLERQQPRGLVVGLHRQQLGRGRRLRERGAVVVDSTPASREQLAGSPPGTRAPRRPPSRRRAGACCRTSASRPRSRLLASISGRAEQVLLRHAAVLEQERRGVRGADAELVLEPLEHPARGWSARPRTT